MELVLDRGDVRPRSQYVCRCLSSSCCLLHLVVLLPRQSSIRTQSWHLASVLVAIRAFCIETGASRWRVALTSRLPLLDLYTPQLKTCSKNADMVLRAVLKLARANHVLSCVHATRGTSTRETNRSPQQLRQIKEHQYYGLYGPGIESRWGRDFSQPSRPPLGPTQPPIQWVPGLFPGVKRPGRGVDHPPPSSAEVKETVELYLYSPSGPSWPVLGSNLPLRVFHLLGCYTAHGGNCLLTFLDSLPVPFSRVRKPKKNSGNRWKRSCPETSVNNYQYTMCNIPEERRPHLHHGGGVESNVSKVILIIIINNTTH
jgi:hypothetical protein